MRLKIIAAAVAAAFVLLAVTGWLVPRPDWAIQLAQQQVEQTLGRNLHVSGGASLSLSPLAIRLENVTVSSPQGQDESFLSARAVVVPVGIGDLLARRFDASGLVLEGVEFALLVSDRGEASWTFGERQLPPFEVTVTDAAIRYFDARNGQSLAVGGFNGRLSGDREGGVTFAGTGELGGRLARIDAALRSLARVHGDGSPFDLSLEQQSGDASFSGRLSTAKVLSLAGTVSLASRDALETLRWAGLPLEGEAALPLNIDGGLDSAGRAFAIRDAAVTLGRFRAAGRVVFDLRNATPKLQADLKAPSLDLTPLIPESGGTALDWGQNRLALGLLKSFDAEIAMQMDGVSYNGLATGAAQALVTLTGGKLDAALAARTADGGVLSARSLIDATGAPPQATFELTAENTEAAPVLSAFAGQNWLSGKGTLSAALKATGSTQQEMAGTLSGTASLSLGPGALKGIDIVALLPAVTQRILDGWGTASAQTPFTALGAGVVIADGIAKLATFTLDAPGVKLTASGEADLLRRAIDLRANPRIVDGETGALASLPVAIAVRGPWDKPRIHPDIEGLLANPEAGFARLKEMGLAAAPSDAPATAPSTAPAAGN